MWAVLFVFACLSLAATQDMNDVKNLPKYDKRYDYLSVDEILENKRLVKNYVDCLINAKPCTPEGKALRRILPEALRTKCVRCTESQKQTAVKVIRRVKSDYPEDWRKLASRWDPTGDFTRYFEEFLTKNTISNCNDIPGSAPAAPLPPRPTLPQQPPQPATVPPQPPRPTLPQPVTLPPPPPPTQRPMPPPSPPAPASPLPPMITPSRPAILNRFGDDGSLMVNQPAQPAARPTTARPVTARSTQMTWSASASDAVPTRFSLRPSKDMAPPYTTAITLIDQIGHKIIRTTELVTDILRNTVRAVVGRGR